MLTRTLSKVLQKVQVGGIMLFLPRAPNMKMSYDESLQTNINIQSIGVIIHWGGKNEQKGAPAISSTKKQCPDISSALSGHEPLVVEYMECKVGVGHILMEQPPCTLLRARPGARLHSHRARCKRGTEGEKHVAASSAPQAATG